MWRFIILILFVHLWLGNYTAQKKNDPTKGLLELRLEKTYWDKEQKKLRSEGYLNVMGFEAIGQQYGVWKYYYKNGKLEEVSEYYAGRLNGKVTQYYENGKKRFEGYFFLGQQDSIFRVYFPDGQLAEEGYYNSIPDSIRQYAGSYIQLIEYFPKIKVGTWKTFYENGQPFTVEHFTAEDTAGKLIHFWNNKGEQLIKDGNGSLKDYYQSGKPKEEINYVNGKKHGKYAAWNANGKPKEVGAYDNGEMDGEWVYYYNVSGGVYQKVGYKKGLKEGYFEERMPNDSLSIRGSFSQGLKHGKWTYYFENSSKDMEGEFKEDVQEGYWQFWYPNGQLYYAGNFSQGLKEGEWKFYYNKGQLWREGTYKADKKDGVWKTYYENGQLLSEGLYLKDKQHGVWESYYENGIVKDKGSFDMGQMTAAWTGNYPNGKKLYEGFYERDMKTGTWKHYFSNGKLKDEGNYKILPPKKSDIDVYNISVQREHSFKHGYWKSYSEKDGKLVSEGSYFRDRQSGTWKYYYPGGVIVAQEINYNTKGELHGPSINNSIKGKTISEVNYKEGKKHGDFKVYDKKGNLIKHQIYKNGVKDKDVIQKIDYKYSKNKK
jgi:antitoxin component YwqK of YwqJK toxin-antitoxin module